MSLSRKRIVFINTVCNGSTGKIMCELAKEANKNGFESFCFYGRGNANNDVESIKVDNKISILFHVLLARLGFNGHGSYFATKKMIKQIKKINPEIIHLHNIHGYYLNFKLLFKYLKNEYKGKIIWTLHDCWAFTGHCAYFTYVNCNKWQKQCYNCPQLSAYPKEYFDTTKREYKLKKELFTGINNLTIITPSKWLMELVKKSFLKEYDVEVINNGIDLNIFKPTIDENIYQKYNIPRDKKIILGVANVWEKRKGLDIFIELANYINNEEIIVLVGLNTKQIEKLPKNIIGITRTDNQKDLAKIYSIATVFLNPSYEETFSLVIVEALACGLPVVVCGMSAPKELIGDKVGIVVNTYTAQSYYKAYLKLICNNFDRGKISMYAQKYSNEKMTNENIEIYKEN